VKREGARTGAFAFFGPVLPEDPVRTRGARDIVLRPLPATEGREAPRRAVFAI